MSQILRGNFQPRKNPTVDLPAEDDLTTRFEAEALKENLMSLLAALNKSRPASSKGVFLKKVTLSTTMGPGVRLDTSGL